MIKTIKKDNVDKHRVTLKKIVICLLLFALTSLSRYLITNFISSSSSDIVTIMEALMYPIFDIVWLIYTGYLLYNLKFPKKYQQFLFYLVTLFLIVLDSPIGFQLINVLLYLNLFASKILVCLVLAMLNSLSNKQKESSLSKTAKIKIALYVIIYLISIVIVILNYHFKTNYGYCNCDGRLLDADEIAAENIVDKLFKCEFILIPILVLYTTYLYRMINFTKKHFKIVLVILTILALALVNYLEYKTSCNCASYWQ
jgi:hypothetical protein